MTKRNIIIISVTVIILILIGGLSWLYSGNLNKSRADVFKKTNLPFAFVGSNPITSQEFYKRYDLAQDVLKDDPQYNEEQIKQQIFGQLIDTAKLKSITSEYDIQISDEDLNREYKAFADNFTEGDESAFAEQVKQTYKMEPEEFKEEIIKPELLNSNLSLWYYGEESLNTEIYAKAREVRSKLDAGEKFEDLAKQYSEDQNSRELGGESGILPFNQLLPEFQKSFKDVKADDIMTIHSRGGVHIVKIISVEGEDKDKQIALQQVFFMGKGFQDWYKQQQNDIRTLKLINI